MVFQAYAAWPKEDEKRKRSINRNENEMEKKECAKVREKKTAFCFDLIWLLDKKAYIMWVRLKMKEK